MKYTNELKMKVKDINIIENHINNNNNNDNNNNNNNNSTANEL